MVSIQGVMMAGFLTLVVTTMMLLLHTYGHRDTGNVVSWMDSRKSPDVHIIGSFGQSSGVTMPHGHASSDRLCTSRHGDKRYRVSCDADKAPPSPLPQDATVFEFDEYPKDERLWPEIGNGHVATVVKGDSMFMNGLYNGKARDSHRARLPSTVAVSITSITPSNVTKKFALDIGRGVYYERYDGDGFYVELRMYAHRVVTSVIAIELIIADTSGNRNGDVAVTLHVNNGTASDDITWTKVDDSGQITSKSGYTKEAEYPAVAPVTPMTVFSSNIPSRASLPGGISKEDVVFFTSISTDKSKAIDGFNQAMALMSNGTLYSSHVAAWGDLWEKGRVDVEGNLTLARINYACLYYLTSSLPLKEDAAWPFVGLSPGGLAHGARGKDYNGHVFWDQSTWMFPPIMMLHADLGRTVVGTRIRTLKTAQMLANSTGYRGARFPWESAFTGMETSPSEACGDLEQHITGDVSLAFRQYLQLTNDTDFLTLGRGLDAITNMAEFWASRVVKNTTTNLWEIHGVMPPDEYHYNVSNSVYTNTIAKLSLLTGVYASKMAGQVAPDNWQDIADNMYIPFDDKLQYHPEFDTYTIGTVVKQADAVMLDFPLMSQLPQHVLRNDVTIYEKVTPGGPAMTWGIFAINWLQLGDKVKADSLFQRTILNVQKPFYIWTENADGSGAVNFHTGMGGYLQAVIFGYGGFRIEDTQLAFNPNLPPSTTRFSITGLDYGGNSVDLAVDATNMTVTATSLAIPMTVTVFGLGVTDNLLLDQPRTYARQRAALRITFK
ncbi:protein-glucosylgalactosylhydroxylysine glucosidase-like [Haliotis cracherodii]|uniref:protein-glucosylgalactosylhydroxylysine glucosidase-like n=1 Tax=Haliotis cracherodii TaxID=6455 RepID=UPI0039E96E2F